MSLNAVFFFQIYKGVVDVVSKMLAKEGALSLYHGLSPTLIQIGPYTGCQFAIYKFLMGMYDKAIDGKGASIKSLTCGAVAGAVAKTLVYPLDLGKKRMQLQGFCNRHRYKGYEPSSDCDLKHINFLLTQ